MYNVYTAGLVTRYHTDPVLSRVNQTVAEHTQHMLALLYYLKPTPPSPELVKNIVFHDYGEHYTGDMPFLMKRRCSKLKRLLDQHEQDGFNTLGIPQEDTDSLLTEEDMDWLSFLDRLECTFFVLLHAPFLRARKDWVDNNNEALELAERLGVKDRTNELIRSMINRYD